MSKSLAFVASIMSVLLITLAMKRSPTPLTLQRSHIEVAAATAATEPQKIEFAQLAYAPATVTMPEPVVISTWLEAGRIKEPEIRAFVRQKANFREDRVLYFEWLGCAGDVLTSENNAQQKKYTITLHSGSGEQNVTHRQVFIIPVTYTYDVHIGTGP